MTEEIVVIGAGGFGRETLDVVEAVIAAGAGYRLLGVVDGEPRDVDLQRLQERGVAYLGSDSQWIESTTGHERFIAAIGAPSVRRAVVDRIQRVGLRAISVVHPRASIGSQTRLGHGVVIASGVQVSTNVTIGNHVHLNPGCIIGHDATLADLVSVNPGAIVSGNATIDSAVLLGAGSTVLQGLRIGHDATVGAAACVTKDVLPSVVMVGVPARPMGQKTAYQHE